MNKIVFSIGVLSLTTFCFWSNSLAQKVIDLDIGDEDVRILGTDAGDRAGERLATGDINGNGVDDFIISATLANGGTGVVYVILGATTLPGTINLATADITILGENPGDVFGWGLETGDVNNDNFDDILVGAVDADPLGRTNAGKAHIIFGSSSLPSMIDLSSTPADLTILGDDPGDKLGVRVASGDVNDDGIDDFIVGAFQGDDPLLLNPGKVYVFFGNNTLPNLIDLDSQSADVTVSGEAAGDQFGISVWGGDVNGDSVDDILVGANNADTPSGANAGRAYVIYGGSSLPSIIDLSSTAADLTILGNNPNSQFGFPLRSGDVNSDTIEDIVIAACCIDAGEIVVIFGGGSLPNTIDLGSTPPDVDILGENAGDIFSGFPFAVKDVNNDMIDDIIAGALLADPPGRPDAGKSYVLFGRNSWPSVIDLGSTSADITIWGDDADDLSGVSIGAGDVNDDSINDIIVGAVFADPNGESQAGETYIIFGVTVPVFRVERSTGDVFAKGSFIPSGADIAERINVSEPVESGDVVELDPSKPGHYRKARGTSHLVAGVITTAPGFTLGNSPAELASDAAIAAEKALMPREAGRPMLALMGRVPVKATIENGPIRLGDLLTASSKPGYAMRCTEAKDCEGVIIGKALEGLKSGEGLILVLVMSH